MPLEPEAIGLWTEIIWNALGMRFDGCHCLLGRQDGIGNERYAEMKQTKRIAQVTTWGKSLPIVA